VTFDAERGTFSLTEGNGLPVAVTGAGAVAYWTGHALERWGYRVATQPAQVRVHAHHVPDGPRWTITTSAGHVDCGSWAEFERQMSCLD
jgi:hypothetical protein